MKNIACIILSYEVTKGMKSYGPMGLLRSGKSSKELILCQIDSLNHIFNNPDIYVVSGFGADKLTKKLPPNTNTILNNEYEFKNHGYAMKLILSSIDSTKYDGYFILGGNTLIKKLQNKIDYSRFDSSWIVCTSQTKTQKIKFMGSTILENGIVDYIFYDVGENIWRDAFYLCNQDFGKLKDIIGSFYDNMFLFEIINKSISNYNLIFTEMIIPSKFISTIQGMKDKSKIKL